MKRKKSKSVIRRNQTLLTQIKQIKTDHPLWGYRRVWSYLKYRQEYPVAINRVHRIIKEHKLFLISDNGCQPTSQRFMMNCSLLNIKQIFTTWSNPKGNSDTERVMRTIKEDIVWPYD